jgi:hypothetical protein
VTALRDPKVKKWPKALSPNRVRAVIDRPALTGAPVLRGRPQTVVSSAGGWRFSYGEVAFTGRRYLQFRALLAHLKGGLNPVYISPYDYEHAPYVLAGLTRPETNEFTDFSGFTDTSGPGGSGWQFRNSSDNIALSDDCAAESTRLIAFYYSGTPALHAGDYFELGGRLHLLEETRDLGGGDVEWKFWPPTRQAYVTADKIEIDDPRCLCYLDPAADGADPDVQFGQLGYGNFEFVEARW